MQECRQMSGFDEDDVEYRVVGGASLLGRLYKPRAVERPPIVVDVHGGGWIGGNRLNNAAVNKALANSGIAVFALDFRMPPVARFPAALDDINYGIRWLKHNAERLSLAPAPLGGIGTSSGGHLLLLNAMKPGQGFAADPDLAGVAADLDFVIACWPVADPLARYHMALKKGLQSLIDAHKAFWPDEAAMATANPQLMLERDEVVKLPPLLLLQGTNDENVEHERADQFAEWYRLRGGAADLRKYIGAAHAFTVREPQSVHAQEAIATIIKFVKGEAAKNELGRASMATRDA
jgi:acetyl esterase/lipase